MVAVLLLLSALVPLIGRVLTVPLAAPDGEEATVTSLFVPLLVSMALALLLTHAHAMANMLEWIVPAVLLAGQEVTAVLDRIASGAVDLERLMTILAIKLLAPLAWAPARLIPPSRDASNAVVAANPMMNSATR